MTGTCRLCGATAELQESHIIPSFVFAYHKEVSSTGYLRSGQSPNLRQQDGLKLHFLCRPCEQRLNQWETPFASNLFRPYHDRQAPPFQYGPWMAKCTASIVWRALAYLLETGRVRDLTPEIQQRSTEALTVWKDFLFDNRADLDGFELHLIPLDTIQETTMSDWPKKINRYFLCVTDVDFLHSSTTAVVLVKMLRLVLIGFVREPEAAKWQGTKIDLTKGQIAPCSLYLPDWLGDYFKHRAEWLAQCEASISEKQKNRIHADQGKKKERVLKSETMRALLADQWLYNGGKDSNA